MTADAQRAREGGYAEAAVVELAARRQPAVARVCRRVSASGKEGRDAASAVWPGAGAQGRLA